MVYYRHVTFSLANSDLRVQEEPQKSMLAVIKTGGKQYLVEEGQTLQIEKIEQEPGASISFEALLVSQTDGSGAKVGKPLVAGASVSAKVIEQGREDKVLVVKYKPKVRYRRHVGHRQPFTKIKIEKISA